MCCSYGVISRSDPCFSLLSINPSIASSAAVNLPTHVASLRQSLISGRPRSQIAIRRRNGSFRISAASSDNSAASPPAMEMMSFYELLGISETVSTVEIKQAYKQLARKYHPDVSPPDRVEEYTQRFIRVQEAYETLSDPGRRALYDSDMARGLHLAFSARRRNQRDEMEERGEWRNRWQSQLSELQRRSSNKDNTRGNMSWGARMRRHKNDPPSDL